MGVRDGSASLSEVRESDDHLSDEDPWRATRDPRLLWLVRPILSVGIKTSPRRSETGPSPRVAARGPVMALRGWRVSGLSASERR